MRLGWVFPGGVLSSHAAYPDLSADKTCLFSGRRRGEGLPSEAFVTITENVWPSHNPGFACFQLEQLCLGWFFRVVLPVQPQGTAAFRIRPVHDTLRFQWVGGWLLAFSRAAQPVTRRQHSWVLGTTDHHPSYRTSCAII